MDVLQRKERLVVEVFVVLRERNFGWDWPRRHPIVHRNFLSSISHSHNAQLVQMYRKIAIIIFNRPSNC